MKHSPVWTWPARVVVVMATLAGVLVPAWAAPSRVISVPRTQALAMSFSGWHRAGFTSSLETFPFAPTHVAFVWRGSRGSAILYRSRTSRGLSRWRRAPEADDLQHGDVHYSGVLSVEGITAIQWRADVPTGQGMGAVTLDYMNTLDGPRVTERIPALAEASPTTPHVVTRAEWGADESIKRTAGGCERHFFPVQQLFVHHTAGTNFEPHPRATMRAIYYFHVKIRGWCDIGYNFVIGPDGTIYEGRWARRYSPWETHTSETRFGLGVMGAHVEGFNAGSIGISVMGNYSLIKLPAAMRASLDKLLAWEADRHHLWPKRWHTYHSPDSGIKRWLPFIAGHRDAGATACPGNYLYAALPLIRRETSAVIGAGKYDSVITLEDAADVVKYKHPTAVTGKLTKRSGDAIASARLRLYIRRPPLDWRYAEVKTGPHGGFSLQLAPRSHLTIRAVYHGNHHIWGSESRKQLVLVTPRLGFKADGGTLDESGVVHYPAGTTSVGLSGWLRPHHAGLKMRVRVRRWEDSAPGPLLATIWSKLDSEGRFAADFAVPAEATGTYRAIARFPSDGNHTTALSRPVFFEIDPAPADGELSLLGNRLR